MVDNLKKIKKAFDKACLNYEKANEHCWDRFNFEPVTIQYELFGGGIECCHYDTYERLELAVEFWRGQKQALRWCILTLEDCCR